MNPYNPVLARTARENDMICHKVRIPYKYGQVVRIAPIGDIHGGHDACDMRSLKTDLEDDDEAYIFGIGDWLDSVVLQDARRYMKEFDDTTSQAIVDEQIDEMANVFMPYQKRTIGVGMGNHELTILKTGITNPTERLARRLDCKNLGYSGILRLILSENGSRGRTIDIHYHHGYGGSSRTEGGELTKYARVAHGIDADVYCYGHGHQLKADRFNTRLAFGQPKTIKKDQWLVLCGTYQKTYLEGAIPTYAEMKAYKAQKIGHPTIHIKPRRNWVKMWVTV